MPIIKVDKGYRNTAYPRMETEGVDVFPGSSLAVIGLWVFFLRQRFQDKESQALPWIWNENLRPEDDEDGDVRPDGSPRRIEIESMYNTEKLNRDYRPSVFIGRGGNPITPIKQVVDNKVGNKKQTGFNAYHIMINMPLVIEIQSENAGECSTLGDIVWSYVLTTRDICRHDFGFHEVTEPILSDTIPNKKDKEIWETKVSFAVQLDQRWGVTPIAPKLREILMLIKGNKEGADSFLTQLAVRDEDGR